MVVCLVSVTVIHRYVPMPLAISQELSHQTLKQVLKLHLEQGFSFTKDRKSMGIVVRKSVFVFYDQVLRIYNFFHLR